MEQKQKKIEDLNVIELKAALFDIEMNIKKLQNDYQQIAQILQNKILEEKK